MNFSAILPSQVIEFLGLAIVVIGLFLKLARDKSNIDVAINANQINVNENRIKIVEVEGKLLSMKQDYEKQIMTAQTSFFQALGELKKENREDHQIVFVHK